MRIDNRANTDLRKLKITRGFVGTADGSVLIEMGNTRVICTASIEEKVPQFLKDQKKGWVTAEYSMLPKSSHTRIARVKHGKDWRKDARDTEAYREGVKISC